MVLQSAKIKRFIILPAVSIDRRDLAMECGDLRRFANAKNLLSQYSRFLLDTIESQQIIANMAEQVRASWYHVVKAHGVSERDADTIKGAFAYPGFEV